MLEKSLVRVTATKLFPVLQAVKTALSSDGSVGNLYYATLAQLSLGQSVDKAGLAKVLAAALKKDDSVTNLGYAFNLAADVLDAKDGAAAVYDRIEDAIVQADEVDGKMLQVGETFGSLFLRQSKIARSFPKTLEYFLF